MPSETSRQQDTAESNQLQAPSPLQLRLLLTRRVLLRNLLPLSALLPRLRRPHPPVFVALHQLRHDAGAALRLHLLLAQHHLRRIRKAEGR